MYKELIISKLKQLVKKYLPTATAAVILVMLMAYTLYNSLDLSTVRAVTTPAVKSTEYEIAGLTGYVFRDEEVLSSINSGAAVYRVGDGEKLAADTLIAEVYTYGSTAAYLKERYALEKSIELLKRSVESGRITATGVSGTKASMNKIYTDIMTSVSGGNLTDALKDTDELLVYLNAYDLITGKNDSLDDELESERTRLKSLENSYTGVYDTITNPRSGYFFYSCDGFEDVFKYELIDTLTAENLQELAAATPILKSSKYAVGKMVYNYVWYLAVMVDSELCLKLTDSWYCNVTFPDSGLELDLTLERIAFNEGDEKGVLILSSGVMPTGFDYARVQNIELLVSTTTGYRVPDTAIHEVEGIKGVYILSSSTVKFRKINVLFKGDGYYVVAERDMNSENYEEYLNLNDEIIVSLSDDVLFDGRILN